MTASALASSAACANDLRQIQEDRIRTVYACGAATSPKLFKWIKEWEAYGRWDEGNPRATNVLALIDEDELEAIADPSKNKVPAAEKAGAVSASVSALNARPAKSGAK